MRWATLGNTFGPTYRLIAYLAYCENDMIAFIHSVYFYSAPSSPGTTTQKRFWHSTETVHSTNAVPEFHAEAPQATASKGLIQGPYVADRAGLEPATLQTKGVESTNGPPRPIALHVLLHVMWCWPSYDIPVWSCMWFLRLACLLNPRSQKSHLNGQDPLCTYMWLFRSPGVGNDFEHSWHLWGFSCSCVNQRNTITLLY